MAQPAEGGKANEAAVAAVADLLGVSRKMVSLVGGHTTPRKRVHVVGIDPASARDLIKAAIDK